MTRHGILPLLATTFLLSTFAITGHASAHEPHPGLQFSIAIDGVPGCDTRHGDATCELPLGSTFDLDVYLDSLPDDIPSYEGFDIYLEYSGVIALHDANTAAWPECAFPASGYGQEKGLGDRVEYVVFGCARGLPPAGPSTYTGLIGTNTFTCDASGSITLVHGAKSGNTDLVERVVSGDNGETPSQTTIHSEGDGTSETINITCTTEPTPTPPPVLPSTGQHPLGGAPIPVWLVAALFGLATITIAPLRSRSRRNM